MQVVPQGIESVNGSSVTIGCTSPLVESGGTMVCGSQSYLFDGCPPDIDTSTFDWASWLVTVRRNEGNLNFAHVLLTFGFDTAVSLTGIEMDLFNCPDWNIGAPYIYVYLNPDYTLTAPTILYSLPFVIASVNSLQSSCDSLSTVTISGDMFLVGSYRTVYILLHQSLHSSIQWVHVGEVRFIGIDSPMCLLPTPSSSSPSSEPQPSSSTSPVATSVGYSSQSGQYATSITSSSPIKLSSFHFSTSLSSSLTSRKCYDNTC